MYCPSLALAVHAATDASKGQKLSPSISAAAFMAILAIVIAGMFMVALAVLGGHWARRQNRLTPQRTTPADRRPLHSKSEPPIQLRDPNDFTAEDSVADDPGGRGETTTE